MSNSRRARRTMARTRQHALDTIRDAASRYPGMVAEAVATLDQPTASTGTAVVESGTVEAPRSDRPGRMLIQLIKAGWSLNGNYYPAAVLRRDGPKAWPAGTQSFVDHATDEEDEQRPAGSITRLAAVQTTDARWDKDRNALVAEVRLFQPWRQPLTDMAGHIGMSIRAWVTGQPGEAEGRQGFVVDGIPEGRSVDFVTKPAAGGQIVSVLESAQAKPADEARNVGAWLESRLHLSLTQIGDHMYGDGRLTRQERKTLSGAIGDALQAWTARVEADAPQLFERDLFDEPPAGEQPAQEASTEDTRARLHRAVSATHGDDDNGFTWVLDFDPDAGLVWFEADDKLWQQSYTVDGRTVSLTGDRVEVTRRSVYEPVNAEEGAADAGEATANQTGPADTPPAAATPDEPTATETGEAAPPVTALPVAESATELARIDRLLGHTPTDVPAAAGSGQTAGGSPPTAPSENQEAPMSGTQDGARAPDQAGTAAEARTTNTPAQPVEATEAQVAVVTQERDQYRSRANSLAEAMTESQNAQRKAEAERDSAVTEMRRYRANEAGRQAVDRLLVAAESGVPEQLQAHISPRVHAAVHNQVPLTDAGEVDTAALESLVQSAIRQERVHAAQLLEAQGVGRVEGLGSDGDPTMQMTQEQWDKQVSGLFADIGLDESTVQLATKGR